MRCSRWRARGENEAARVKAAGRGNTAPKTRRTRHRIRTRQDIGKGEKGQKARSGAHIHPWFEGGQLPLHRRVPKRGFTNRFKKVYATVNLKDLERFDAGTHVTPDLLQERRLVKDLNAGLKVLADGVLSKPLSVTAHKFSKRSIEKIVACGGTVEVIGA